MFPRNNKLITFLYITLHRSGQIFHKLGRTRPKHDFISRTRIKKFLSSNHTIGDSLSAFLAYSVVCTQLDVCVGEVVTDLTDHIADDLRTAGVIREDVA